MNYLPSLHSGGVMKKYRITIKFDRLNQITGQLEERTTRYGEFFAVNKKDAKALYLLQFKKNEPRRVKVHSVDVKELR